MSFDHLIPLFQRYRSKGLLLDTNLFLLYLVECLDPDLIVSFKPTANHGFNQKDFELLKKIASFFSRIVTTPHILTEVSNHSDKLKGEAHQRLFAALSLLVQDERKLHETTLPSARLVQCNEFIKFGLTDTAIGQIAPGNHLVATVDFPLAGHLEKKGVDVINLNHLREQGWRS